MVSTRFRPSSATFTTVTVSTCVLVLGSVVAVLVVSSVLGGPVVGQVGGDSGSETIIEECRDIDEAGTYVLEGDLEPTDDGLGSAGEKCLYVNEDDVVIDGNGYTISYEGNDGAVAGIELNGPTNVTVTNVTVTGWEKGIHSVPADDVELVGITATNNHKHGIHIHEGSDVRIHDSTTLENGENGIYVHGSTVEIRDTRSTDSLYLSQSGSTATGFDIGPSTASGTTLDFTAEDVELGATENPAGPPDGEVSIGRYFDATSTENGVLNASLHYDVDDTEGVDDSSLTLQRYDEDTNEWADIPGSSVDTENRRVSANITSFSSFGAFGEPTEHFEVSTFDAPESADDGETVSVSALVENTGEETGTQSIEYRFDGSSENTTEVELDSGENETLTFTHTVEADAGTYTHGVYSEDDDDSAAVTILEPADFGVTIDETNSPVVANGTLTVDATITNEGEAEDTQTISLETGSVERDSAQVTLAGGTNEVVTLEWPTTESDAGDHTVTVSSEDDTDSTAVTVLESSYFAMSIDGSTEPVVEGEPLEVTVTVENTGGLEDTQKVTLETGGEVLDETTVTLERDEDTVENLTWNTSAGDAGTHTVTAASANESADTTVTVEAAPSPPGGSPGPFPQPEPEPEPEPKPEPEAAFDVSIEETNDPVFLGDQLTVTAVVENVGETAGNTTLTLLVDDSPVDSRSLALEDGEHERSTLTYTTADADDGELPVTVRVQGASDSRVVTVEDEPSDAEPSTPTTPSAPTDSDEANETGTEELEPPAEPIEDDSSPVWSAPDWADSAIDYEPSPQTQHVGGFFWLTVLVFTLGSWIFVTRVTLESKVLAVTLFVTALRTATDVVHTMGGGFWIAGTPLTAFNIVLELSIALLFLRFAALYANEHRLITRATTAVMVALTVLATVAVATNPLHSLVFLEFVHVSFPFGYVGAELGPLGWLLLAVNTGLLLAGVGLLIRSFVATENPIWRPVGVIAAGISLALVVGGLSVLERGPLPQYDYTSAGIASFMLLTTGALLGHGLQRVKETAQQSLLEELTDAIVVLDDTRSVVDYNGSARALFPDIEVGRRFETLFEPSLAWPTTGETTTAEVTAETFVAPSSDVCGDGGRDRREHAVTPQRHYLVQTTSVSVGATDTIGYTVRFADVSAIKRQATELARRNEQLDRFAGTVTHDLRNPLTVATGYADLLRESIESGHEDDPVDDDLLSTSLGPIASSLERMRAIIDDILALARSTESVTETYTLSYPAIARSAWESVDTGGATLTVESGGTGTIDADRDRLQRLLENLFRNSVEHVGPDVSIVVGLTETGFYVADDGPGIPAPEREAIFDHGYSGQSDGTGLGLAIVEQLATAHGWDVDLDPDYDGARFVFTGCETTLER